eukprot:scaffold97132_cov30-Tisochrysis_lutea.AAC.3
MASVGEEMGVAHDGDRGPVHLGPPGVGDVGNPHICASDGKPQQQHLAEPRRWASRSAQHAIGSVARRDCAGDRAQWRTKVPAASAQRQGRVAPLGWSESEERDWTQVLLERQCKERGRKEKGEGERAIGKGSRELNAPKTKRSYSALLPER